MHSIFGLSMNNEENLNQFAPKARFANSVSDLCEFREQARERRVDLGPRTQIDSAEERTLNFYTYLLVIPVLLI